MEKSEQEWHIGNARYYSNAAREDMEKSEPHWQSEWQERSIFNKSKKDESKKKSGKDGSDKKGRMSYQDLPRNTCPYYKCGAYDSQFNYVDCVDPYYVTSLNYGADNQYYLAPSQCDGSSGQIQCQVTQEGYAYWSCY